MAKFILLAICVIVPMSPELCTNAVLGNLKGFHCYLSCICSVGVAMEALGVTRGNLADATQTLAGSRRSMGRRIQVGGGQIDKTSLLQIGESSF